MQHQFEQKIKGNSVLTAYVCWYHLEYDFLSMAQTKLNALFIWIWPWLVADSSVLTAAINFLLLKCLCLSLSFCVRDKLHSYYCRIAWLPNAVWRKHSKNFMAICWFFSDFWSLFYGRYNCYNFAICLNQFSVSPLYPPHCSFD